MRKSYTGTIAGILGLLAFGCAEKPPLVSADSIYFNGNVITLDSTESVAEAIAIKKGKILAVGRSTVVIQMSDENTRKIDLQGKSIVPGFVDAHSHLSGCGYSSCHCQSLTPS